MTFPGPPAPVFQARIDPGAQSFQAPAGRTLLLAAADAGLEMPSSCRNGSCRTCMCKLLEGEVQYRIEWPGLLAEEKAQGFILPCVAYPLSDVVLTFL
jgi:ferredoxin